MGTIPHSPAEADTAQTALPEQFVRSCFRSNITPPALLNAYLGEPVGIREVEEEPVSSIL